MYVFTMQLLLLNVSVVLRQIGCTAWNAVLVLTFRVLCFVAYQLASLIVSTRLTYNTIYFIATLNNINQHKICCRQWLTQSERSQQNLKQIPAHPYDLRSHADTDVKLIPSSSSLFNRTPMLKISMGRSCSTACTPTIPRVTGWTCCPVLKN